MKCPNDTVEMEKGYLDFGHWVSGNKTILASIRVLGRRAQWATAYKCPKCGEIKLKVEEEK